MSSVIFSIIKSNSPLSIFPLILIFTPNHNLLSEKIETASYKANKMLNCLTVYSWEAVFYY